MRSRLATLGFAFAVLLTIGQSQHVLAGNTFDGDVDGVELITQDIGGQAVFLFRFRGQINGRQRTGIGIVGFNHESLPNSSDGQADISSGNGRIYVGFRSYAISEVTGTITLEPDSPFFFIFPLQFDVAADLRINNEPHSLNGVLRHDTLPFSFAGGLTPGS